MNKEQIQKLIKDCKKGYNKSTKDSFALLIKECSKELGGTVGKVTCLTCRKFVVGYFEKKLRLNK